VPQTAGTAWVVVSDLPPSHRRGRPRIRPPPPRNPKCWPRSSSPRRPTTARGTFRFWRRFKCRTQRAQRENRGTQRRERFRTADRAFRLFTVFCSAYLCFLFANLCRSALLPDQRRMLSASRAHRHREAVARCGCTSSRPSVRWPRDARGRRANAHSRGPRPRGCGPPARSHVPPAPTPGLSGHLHRAAFEADGRLGDPRRATLTLRVGVRPVIELRLAVGQRFGGRGHLVA